MRKYPHSPAWHSGHTIIKVWSGFGNEEMLVCKTCDIQVEFSEMERNLPVVILFAGGISSILSYIILSTYLLVFSLFLIVLGWFWMMITQRNLLLDRKH